MPISRRTVVAALAIMLFSAFVYAVNPAPKPDTKTTDNKWGGRVVTLAKHALKAGADTVVLDIDIPRGYHFAPDAPTKLKWTSGDEKVLSFAKDINSGKGATKFPVTAVVTTHPGATEIVIDAAVFFCENGSKLCQMDNVRIKAPVEIATTGAEKITLSIDAGQDEGDD